jgi:DNA-binding NarL/FixJ family response regulator
MRARPKKHRLKKADRSTGSNLPKHKIRLVVVNEHPICRWGLRHILEQDGRFEILAETDRAKTAVRTIIDHEPHAALLDAGLPGNSNLEIARFLQARGGCTTQLVLLVEQPDETLLNHAVRLGVKGLVLRRSSVAEIIDCVAAVASGRTYVSPDLTGLLLNNGTVAGPGRKQKTGLRRLTPSERRVLKQIAFGKTSWEIAAEFRISRRTVDSHRAHICEKLGLMGTNCLLQFAVGHRESLRYLR